MEYAQGQFPGSINIGTTSATGVLVVPGAPTRRTLMFGSSSLGAYVVNVINPGSTSLGFLIPANTRMVVLRYTDWGELVRKPWFAQTGGAPISFAWAEVLDG